MVRPSLYSEEIVKEICERLAAGEPLEEICRDEGMPSSRTVRDWQDGRTESVPKSVIADIARARETGFNAIANNTRTTARGRGESTGDVQRDKLIIDTDLKLLAKWYPKVYGDSTTLKGDPENPIQLALATRLSSAIQRKNDHS